MHYLGVDWADQKHQLSLKTKDGQVVSDFIITHDWNGFEALQAVLAEVGPVAINLERSDGLLVDWMIDQGWDVFVTPPRVVAGRRPRRSKGDRGDARLLADLCRLKDEDCRPIIIQSEIVETLRPLVRAFNQLQRQQLQHSNQLRQVLKQYYPSAVRAFTKLHGPVALAFLTAYPAPEVARKVSYEELSVFLRGKGYKCMRHFDKLYQRLHSSMPTARVPDGHIVHMKALVSMLQLLHQQLKHLEKQIEINFDRHPEAAWWRSFPGTGLLTAARLLAYVGDDRAAFPSYQVLQTTAGTAPVTRQSGKQTVVQFRWACSKPLRKAATDLARNSLRKSGWARSYFCTQKELGHDNTRAYRALANRWLRIIWTLWQRREVYDEVRHVTNRSRNGLAAPLVLVAAAS